VCSQKQPCIIPHWLCMCLLFVHQKLKIRFFSVGCCAIGVLWNVILKDFHAMSSHVLWLHFSLSFNCFSSLVQWKLCAIFRVIFDVTFCAWRQREICCSGKCKLSCRACRSSCKDVCALSASLSPHMLISSWSVYGGPRLSACPLT
jgi:hypothetical protein